MSPESESILDFILELFQIAGGSWTKVVDQANISAVELEQFLNYAAVFLANIGNYYVRNLEQDINMSLLMEVLLDWIGMLSTES